MQTQEITTEQPDRCATAQNALLDSTSTCGDAFFAFQNAYFDDDSNDIAALRENLNQICQRESCKSAVSEYLEACGDTRSVRKCVVNTLDIQIKSFLCHLNQL